ncbi:MAG: hypothetical protein U9N30_00445 [Campylobacterota bacterium]|nr:hypothetical protein [Campylobacterota bacterium]
MIYFKTFFLYLIPFVFVAGVLLIFYSESNHVQHNEFLEKIHEQKKFLTTQNTIDILESLEKVAQKHEVQIIKIVHQDERIVAYLKASYSNGMIFLNKAELINKALNIQSMQMDTMKSSSGIKIVVYFSLGQKLNTYRFEDLQNRLFNPFVLIKEQEHKFKLHAVIGDIAYVDQFIVKHKDTFKGYRVEHIGKNTVTLKKNTQKLILKVYDE